MTVSDRVHSTPWVRLFVKKTSPRMINSNLSQACLALSLSISNLTYWKEVRTTESRSGQFGCWDFMSSSSKELSRSYACAINVWFQCSVWAYKSNTKSKVLNKDDMCSFFERESYGYKTCNTDSVWVSLISLNRVKCIFLLQYMLFTPHKTCALHYYVLAPK